MMTLHWMRPYCLLLIFPLCLLLVYWYYHHKKQAQWQQICDQHLLPYLLLERSKQSALLPFILLAAAGILSVISLAGPSFLKEEAPIYRNTNSLVITLALDNEMYAEDLSPNRLTRAKFKIQDWLHKSDEGQIGLIAFTQEAYVVSPLTQDAATIDNLIAELTPNIMPVQGHDISAALNKAALLLKQAGLTQGEILVITSAPATETDVSLARQLAMQDIRTSVLGVGSTTGAPIPTENGFLRDNQQKIFLAKLDAFSLQQLAKAGRGIYQTITDDNRDIDTLRQYTQHIHQVTRHTQENRAIWKDQGRYVVLLLLPCVVLAFRRGWFEHLVQ